MYKKSYVKHPDTMFDLIKLFNKVMTYHWILP